MEINHGDVVIPIPGELVAVDSNQRVTSAAGVYDYNLADNLEVINSRVNTNIGNVQTKIQNLLNLINLMGDGGTTDYTELTHKPSINGVELLGNLTLEDLNMPDYSQLILNLSTGLGLKANTADVYTKGEVDGLIHDVEDLIEEGGNFNPGLYYTKTDIDRKGYLTQQDISGKANISDVYTKSQLYTRTESDALLNAKASAADLTALLSVVSNLPQNNITVDSTLSSTSTNPVLNQVINGAITNLQNGLQDILTGLNSKLSGSDIKKLTDSQHTGINSIGLTGSGNVQLKTINGKSIFVEGNEYNISVATEGSGDENVIESITVNGNQVPISGKTATIEIDIPELTIESISVNGSSISPNNGNIDITVPTDVNQLSDSSNKFPSLLDRTSWNDCITNVTNLTNNKQDTLVSGGNIKTINNLSILGLGNISVLQSGASAEDIEYVENRQMYSTIRDGDNINDCIENLDIAIENVYTTLNSRKANDSNVVHLTGTETIDGHKDHIATNDFRNDLGWIRIGVPTSGIDLPYIHSFIKLAGKEAGFSYDNFDWIRNSNNSSLQDALNSKLDIDNGTIPIGKRISFGNYSTYGNSIGSSSAGRIHINSDDTIYLNNSIAVAGGALIDGYIYITDGIKADDDDYKSNTKVWNTNGGITDISNISGNISSKIYSWNNSTSVLCSGNIISLFNDLLSESLYSSVFTYNGNVYTFTNYLPTTATTYSNYTTITFSRNVVDPTNNFIYIEKINIIKNGTGFTVSIVIPDYIELPTYTFDSSTLTLNINTSGSAPTPVIPTDNPTTQIRWINYDTMCVGYNKYNKQKKQQSIDGGSTWTDVTPLETQQGTLIETNSTDCGYNSGGGGTDDYINQYLTIESLEDDNTISFKAEAQSGAAITKTIYFSVDNGVTWTAVTASTEGTNIATLNNGQKLLLKGDNVYYGNANSHDKIQTDKRFNVYGNIMSLISSTSFSTLTSFTSEYVFRGLFFLCNGLISAENLILPAMTLTYGCYAEMFRGCSNLIKTPQLPATTLAGGCYNSMFWGCTGLSNASALPATVLKSDCYANMFAECSYLITAPELPAETLVQNCYYAMFRQCYNLNYIKAMFITTPDTTYTNGWVTLVSSTGTFVKNSAATWDVTGSSGIPTGWSVQTASA